MKKKTAAIIIAALVITLGGTTAFEFGHSSSSDIKNQRTVSGVSSDIRYNQNSVCSYCKSTGHCFHDSDGDGICDYYKSDTSLGNTGGSYAHHMYGTGHHSEPDHNYNYRGHHEGHGYGHR